MNSESLNQQSSVRREKSGIRSNSYRNGSNNVSVSKVSPSTSSDAVVPSSQNSRQQQQQQQQQPLTQPMLTTTVTLGINDNELLKAVGIHFIAQQEANIKRDIITKPVSTIHFNYNPMVQNVAVLIRHIEAAAETRGMCIEGYCVHRQRDENELVEVYLKVIPGSKLDASIALRAVFLGASVRNKMHRFVNCCLIIQRTIRAFLRHRRRRSTPSTLENRRNRTPCARSQEDSPTTMSGWTPPSTSNMFANHEAMLSSLLKPPAADDSKNGAPDTDPSKRVLRKKKKKRPKTLDTVPLSNQESSTINGAHKNSSYNTNGTNRQNGHHRKIINYDNHINNNNVSNHSNSSNKKKDDASASSSVGGLSSASMDKIRQHQQTMTRTSGPPLFLKSHPPHRYGSTTTTTVANSSNNKSNKSPTKKYSTSPVKIRTARKMGMAVRKKQQHDGGGEHDEDSAGGGSDSQEESRWMQFVERTKRVPAPTVLRSSVTYAYGGIQLPPADWSDEPSFEKMVQASSAHMLEAHRNPLLHARDCTFCRQQVAKDKMTGHRTPTVSASLPELSPSPQSFHQMYTRTSPISHSFNDSHSNVGVVFPTMTPQQQQILHLQHQLQQLQHQQQAASRYSTSPPPIMDEESWMDPNADGPNARKLLPKIPPLSRSVSSLK